MKKSTENIHTHTHTQAYVHNLILRDEYIAISAPFTRWTQPAKRNEKSVESERTNNQQNQNEIEEEKNILYDELKTEKSQRKWWSFTMTFQ